MKYSYGRLIFLGIGILIPGWFIIFLMALNIMESTFLRNFIGFGFSLWGLFIGFLGFLKGRRIVKQKNKEKQNQILYTENNSNSYDEL